MQIFKTKKGILNLLGVLASNPVLFIIFLVFLILLILGIYFAILKILGFVLVLGALFLLAERIINWQIALIILVIGILFIWNPLDSPIFDYTTFQMLKAVSGK